MFLSLKGAIGRNPILNRVGQKLLQSFGGASAAYSLRNLASNIASVVRVRRASDNSEKDFSAEDISSGAMTGWVNSQIVPPLDIRELDSNGERTGDIVEAAAAYSLRNLSSSYTGNVVEVRRNTDGSTRDFNATEIYDNTLTGWVNASFADDLPLDTSSGAAAAYSLRNLSSSYTGNVVDVRRSSDDAEESFTAAEVADGTLTDWVGAGNNGFVSKWYDQSGNDNHATQTDTASQPKIVDGGTYLGKIDFDGVNCGLEFDEESVITNMDDFSSFTVAKSDTTSGTKVALSVSDDTPNASRWYSPILIGGNFAFGYGTSATAVSFGTADTKEHLFSSIAGSTTAEAWKDGTSGGSVSSVTTAPSVISGINLGGSNDALLWNGSIKEIIIYNSDQSDNRTAIEISAMEHYDIALPTGVNTGYNRVDGFVETWYDQSGNGNDAVQDVAGSQPKIVDAGVLVSGGILSDGVGTSLELNYAISTSDEFDIFFTGTATASNWTSLQRSPYGYTTNSDYPRFNDDSFRYTLDNTDSGTTNYNSGFTIGTGTPFLYNFNRDAADSVGAQINGTAQTNRVTLSGTHSISKLFRRGFNTSQVWDGTMSEMIFYPSDQSANRAAIEANINNQYDIY